MKTILWSLLLLVAVVIGGTLAFPDRVAEVLIDLERDRHGLSEKRVMAGGLEWPYLEGGPADAPVILMIHGFSADKDNWTRFAGQFTDRYRVIAPDLPGFGEQARVAGEDYRLGRQIQRLQFFVEALGLKQFHMVGNSMGGHITALYALVHPQQVLSAGLFNNAGIQSPEPSAMDRELAQGRNPLLAESVEDFDRVMAYTMDVPPVLPWPVKPYVARKAVAARDFNAYIFEQIKTDRGSALGAVFGQINVPVLILWGENDRLLHVSATEVMQAALPSAEVVVLEDTGHLPMIERPALTAEHYRAFIESAVQGAAAPAPAISWFDGGVDEAFVQARETRKPLLLYWGADWCPPCNEIRSTVFTRPDFIAQTQKLIPVYLDGDTPGAQKWGAHFGAMGYPTLIVFAPDGTERTRFSSGLEPARYATILADALQGRDSVRELVALVEREPQQLAASDWLLLAQYPWDGDQGQVIGNTPLAQQLRTLAQQCPDGVGLACQRLQLLAWIAAMEAEVPGPQEPAAGRALLRAVLEDPAALRMNLVDLAYAGPDLILALTPAATAEREALATELLAAMDALYADQTLGVKARFLTIRPHIYLWRAAHPDADAAPEALQRAVQARVDWLDEAARTPAERQSVIFIAGGLLRQVGLPDAARSLYVAELERAIAPHYYMSYLASLEADLGRVDAALDWSRRAWESASGPATRLQWGVQYAQMLLRLRPEAAAEIGALVSQVLSELAAEPEAYFQRTRVRLERLGLQLAEWVRVQDQATVWADLRAAMRPLCGRGESAAANPLCAEDVAPEST